MMVITCLGDILPQMMNFVKVGDSKTAKRVIILDSLVTLSFFLVTGSLSMKRMTFYFV